MHYYSFNPADYIMDTVHLDNDHDLAYRRLLDLYYTSEAPIPSETQRVATRLRVGLDVIENVLNEFFERTESGWTQTNCERQIAQYQAKAEASRENGKRGGRPPRPKKTKQVILGTQTKPRSKATKNYKPETTNQELPFNSDDFKSAWDDWNEYRKEKGKPLTERSIKMQLEEIAKWGERPSIQSIKTSIANGYQGLFPAKATHQGSQQTDRNAGTTNEAPYVYRTDRDTDPFDKFDLETENP